MRPIILVVRILIKLLANFLKLLSYAVHIVFPKLRLSLPENQNFQFDHSSANTIVKVIWQTNFTRQVTIPVYLNYLFNRFMAMGFAYRFMVTDERDRFIKENFDSLIYEAYRKIQIGAAQADFWRLLVLYKHGGVYMDIDAHLVWPLAWILEDNGTELFLKIKTGEISNYFIASAPGNPNLLDLINKVVQNINEGTSTNVYDLTGPGVFNEVFKNRKVSTRYYLYTCNQGNFTNEYFQYIDKPQGKWTKEQQKVDVIRRD